MSDDASASLAMSVKRAIIERVGLPQRPEDIIDEEPLFRGPGFPGPGLGLDSTSALEVVVALEQAFSISIPDEDLNLDLLGSVDSIVGYLRGRGVQG